MRGYNAIIEGDSFFCNSVGLGKFVLSLASGRLDGGGAGYFAPSGCALFHHVLRKAKVMAHGFAKKVIRSAISIDVYFLLVFSFFFFFLVMMFGLLGLTIVLFSLSLVFFFFGFNKIYCYPKKKEEKKR